MNLKQARIHIWRVKIKQEALNKGFEKGSVTLSQYQRKWAALGREIVKYQAVTLVLTNKKSYNYTKNTITPAEALRMVK